MTVSEEVEEPGRIPDDPLLRAEGVEKYFESNTGLIDSVFGNEEYVKAVDGVDIAIGQEETVGLVGESGCGKSTLGRTLSRLYEPTGGTINFGDKDVTDISGSELRSLRKEVQVIFQDPLSSLNPRKTTREIIGKPLEVHDLASGQEKRERVEELLEEVGLRASHADRYPHEFSGGQRQRIGIARALAVEPELIIADEPVSALDVSVQAQIINLMKRLQDEYGLSYLFIAHDLSVVKHIADRVAVMYLGHIVEKGPTSAIFKNPQHPYTRALLRSIPSVEGTKGKREVLLEGNPPSPLNPPSGCPFHTRCPEYMGEECEAETPTLKSVVDAPGEIGPPDGTPIDVTGDTSKAEHTVACHWLEEDAEERRSNDPLTGD
ncbi:ABC transporter ATP-binding protein [Halolamina rubra]|uniref:ABC transporter ATP-binding protein n=1 Tax=Halolamina rubra TaxID=1380430 RepID=UPI00067842BC|nr:oligopeptide/dipeptide ABC transporter ATP-binding protein [Halolamina rubra]